MSCRAAYPDRRHECDLACLRYTDFVLRKFGSQEIDSPGPKQFVLSVDPSEYAFLTGIPKGDPLFR